MSYIYEPLLLPDAEIRVAVLQPAQFYDDELRISFGRRVLEEQIPAYEALSYVWGKAGNASSVHIMADQIDKGTINITQNLDVALRNLRFQEKERAVYIDALCINQNDNDEKGKQVAIMGQIYRLSGQTIVWLGLEADDSDKALALLQFFASQVRTDPETSTLHPTEQCVDLSLVDVKIPLPYRSGELSCVDHLLDREYFERTWTRQEVTLAPRAMVKCGAQEITWKDFVQGVMTFHHKRHEREAIDGSMRREYHFKKVVTRAFDLCRLERLGLEYCFLRMIFRDTKCYDQRDKIYAVMSMVPDFDKRLGITPDYNRSVEDVYIDLARRIINDGRLRLLESCELSSQQLDLPTWVPDWSTPMKIERSQSSSCWSACGWITHTATVTKDNVLKVVGVEAAKVEQVIDYELDRWECEHVDVLHFLQRFGKLEHVQNELRDKGRECVPRYCKVLVGELFSNSWLPPHPDKPDFEMTVQFLAVLWMDPGAIDITEDMFSTEFMHNQLLVLNCIHLNLLGKTLFTASDGYIGVAPIGTRPGDVISVILGCKFPLVLRSAPSQKPSKTSSWQVVGVCYTEGLMAGEAIYRGKLSGHYKPVILLHGDERDRIDRYHYALYDTETRTLKNNPGEILTEIGIKVERYQRLPHVLRVPLASLRAAGVPLRLYSLV